MKRIITFITGILVLFTVTVAQITKPVQQGYNAEGNLRAIDNLKPYSDGAKGFDTRYEGVKGSPRLYDTLLPALLKVKNLDYYIQVEADLNISGNSLLFIHPKTRQLLQLPTDIIDEVTFERNNVQEVYRTSSGLNFEKEVKTDVFCQVLKDKPVPLIKIPVKTFTEADYKALYSPDRRYDEYQTIYRYYLMGPDNRFYQVQLNGRSIGKVYPDKKKLIDEAFRNTNGDDEKTVLSLIDKF